MTQLTPPHNSEWIVAAGLGHALQYKAPLDKAWKDMEDGSWMPWNCPVCAQWRNKPEPVVIACFSVMLDDGSFAYSFETLEECKKQAGQFVSNILAYVKSSITDGVAKVEMVN